MEIIKKTITYIIFKPISDHVSYIRCEVENLVGTKYKSYSWFAGRKNDMGLISSVGGDLSEQTQELLEKEYQLYISKNK